MLRMLDKGGLMKEHKVLVKIPQPQYFLVLFVAMYQQQGGQGMISL